jgi:Spy/CpxP family protein refolding chaperone
VLWPHCSRRRQCSQLCTSTSLPKVNQIRENLSRERAGLAKLLFADPPDRERIYAVARQIMGHQSELENEVIEHILEERELLSPSQQRKFYEIIVEQFSTGGLGVHDVRGKV